MSGVRLALAAVEAHLAPLLVRDVADTRRRLSKDEGSQLTVGLSCLVSSLSFCSLVTNGSDPGDYSIRKELDGIHLHYKKVKSIVDEITERDEARNRRRVDVEAAKRIVRHYAAANAQAPIKPAHSVPVRPDVVRRRLRVQDVSSRACRHHRRVQLPSSITSRSPSGGHPRGRGRRRVSPVHSHRKAKHARPRNKERSSPSTSHDARGGSEKLKVAFPSPPAVLVVE